MTSILTRNWVRALVCALLCAGPECAVAQSVPYGIGTGLLDATWGAGSIVGTGNVVIGVRN